jgi:hypothetical protein
MKFIEFQKAHLGNIAYFDGNFYITDQINNKVIIVSLNSIGVAGEMCGYDFPLELMLIMDL